MIEKRDASGDIIPKPGMLPKDNKFIGAQIEAGGETAEMEFFRKMGIYNSTWSAYLNLDSFM